jgi:molybdenum cofactor biosynthesis enzyme MoaA
LRAVGVGKGDYAFHIRFAAALSLTERDALFVRPAGSAWRLELAPELRTTLDDSVFPVPSTPAAGVTSQDFPAVHAVRRAPVQLNEGEQQVAPALASETPLISHVAMDLVDNCNLRCPFCLVDHTVVHRTNMMSEETFRSALRLIPYVSPGNFWLSCGHEPTLHPRLLDFISMVPDEYRDKLFYTTNLAKPMPRDYFAALAESGMHHINVSLESLDAALYERMRKGARHRIFQANWDTMLECFAVGSRPPRMRYIIMAYRSNLAEIPSLVGMLLTERMAWQVEIRYTYEAAHIEQAFREAEYLTTEEWAWLAKQLAHHDTARMVLTAPPGGIGYLPAGEAPSTGQADSQPAPQPATSGPITVPSSVFTRVDRPLNMIVDCTGGVTIYGWEVHDSNLEPVRITYLVTNLRYIDDPLRFIMSL